MIVKKKKVAFLGLRNLPPAGGGSETFAAELGERAVKKGCEVYVYCRNHASSDIKLKEYKGIKLIWLPSINNKNLDTPIHTLFSALHIIFKNKVDVVQLGGVGNAVALPLLKLFGFKTIVIVDGADWERDKWGIVAKFVLKLTAKITTIFADKVICDSQVSQKYYKEKFNTESVFIPYGGKIHEQLDQSVLTKYGLTKDKYILFVGQLKPEKGVHYLIEGYNKAKTKLKLVIVGKNIIKSYTHELKSRASSNPNITIFDPIYGEDIESVLACSAFYIQPSYVEGTSPVILQNLALGNIVLVNGIPENLETIGDAGLSYKVNDIDDLVSKIEYITDNLTFIKGEFSEKAKQRILNIYNWDKVTDQYIEVYAKLINQR
ncbi:MAG: glycosyltransferase [Stygiobacter sp.]|nr:MAG: glycosyltransferase [Stygiobacter sp.]